MSSMPFTEFYSDPDGCLTCGFQLWVPVAESGHSRLGVYSDARFPGRSILALKEHRDTLDSLPMDTLMGFMRDVQLASEAIRVSTGATRVNVAILGNRDSHVHAHLIPRFPALEMKPDCSPWDDPRKKEPLASEVLSRVVEDIRENLLKIDRRKTAVKSTSNADLLF